MKVCAILPISRSGTAISTTSASASACVLIDAVGADGGLQPLPPLFGDLDMVHLEARPVRLVASRTPIFPPAPSSAIFVIFLFPPIFLCCC